MGGGAQNLTEIDAIFAGRGRGTTGSHRRAVVQGTTAASAGPHSPHASGAAALMLKSEPTTTTTKKKKKGKRPATHHDEEAAPVVQDPSQTLPPALKKLKRQPNNPSDPEQERVFRDSRGSSRPTTDDGLPIYSVDELRIGLGQDTPECPFDCQCCF